jgi:hypothetical protein
MAKTARTWSWRVVFRLGLRWCDALRTQNAKPGRHVCPQIPGSTGQEVVAKRDLKSAKKSSYPLPRRGWKKTYEICTNVKMGILN